jgi:hypothetical protein
VGSPAQACRLPCALGSLSPGVPPLPSREDRTLLGYWPASSVWGGLLADGHRDECGSRPLSQMRAEDVA